MSTVGRRIGIAAALLLACSPAGDSSGEGDETEVWITLAPSVVIGEVEGDPDYLFGNVRSVAVDDQGRIYVGDGIGATIRAYSPDGIFLKQVARAGQGPGEIDFLPADLTFGQDERLYVRDASRITVFAASAPGEIADSAVSVWRDPGYRNVLSDRSRVDNNGSYYYPDGQFRIGAQARFLYHVFRDGVPTGDTIKVPFQAGMGARLPAMYRIGGGNLRNVDGLNRVPFGAVPSWQVTAEGTVLSSDGESPHLVETTAAGDTVRIIPLVRDSTRSIPLGEREDSLRALEARIDSLPVPLSEVINIGEDVATRRLPDHVPTVLGVHISPDGRIWIERWPPVGEGEARVYDVHERTGHYIASVMLRAPLVAEPPPYFGRSAIVGVVRDAETDVQRVVKFEIGAL